MESFDITDAIIIWKWANAPEEYRVLSPHGGDEDWVIEIPESLQWYSGILFPEGSRWGCCSISQHESDDGLLILIGAHA